MKERKAASMEKAGVGGLYKDRKNTELKQQSRE